MRIATLMAAVGVTLVGTIAFAQSVTYDFDKATDFSRLKTYAWARGMNLNDELNHKRIMHAVDAQLASKGFSRVEASAHPDAFVAYHAAFDSNLEINGSGWGGYRFGVSRSGTASVQEVLVGTLAIDIVDAKTETIVWRGMASKEIDVKASPEKREKNINKVAEKLFKNYPPKK
jgi:hypothetical protein